jgi:hypothetical protein
MPGDLSETDLYQGHDTPVDCPYSSFTNPQNLQDKKTLKDTAKCGFNQDGLFYCPMH